MSRIVFAAAAIALVVAGGCTRFGASGPGASDGATLGAGAQPVSVEQGVATTSLDGFVPASAVSRLSAKERAEATSAQYYALQFGRPGAPRSWQGDSGASGVVTVGPYVRVNSLDCREFSHTVTVSGAKYDSDGMACREADGSWDVAGS